MWQIEEFERLGKSYPQWYLEKPEIEDFDFFYLDAFQELSTERQIGMGIGNIPASKIREYSRMFHFSVFMEDTFIVIIRAMDNEFISWYNEDQERKSKSSK